MSSSPPPSPLFSRSLSGSSSGHGSGYIPLGVPRVANLFIKLRRHRSKAKAHHIESSSGPEPLTHPGLRGDGAVSPRKVPVDEDVTFVCRDGVDVAKLLRPVRAMVYQKAVVVGANVLVDEQWSCIICGPKHRSDGTFKVYVRYSACGARSDRPDSQRPVALENTRDVPGLMTIVRKLD